MAWAVMGTPSESMVDEAEYEVRQLEKAPAKPKRRGGGEEERSGWLPTSARRPPREDHLHLTREVM